MSVYPITLDADFDSGSLDTAHCSIQDDTVLLAGSVAGLWGPPVRWEPARGRRRFLLSPPRSPP